MSLSFSEITNLIKPAGPGDPVAKPLSDLKLAAKEFESVLLAQLTSSLNGSDDDSEDNLFGSDSGTGLSKQLMSEQLAKTMADAGGIGLSDLLMSQLVRKVAGAQPKSSTASALAGAQAVLESNTNAAAGKPNMHALKPTRGATDATMRSRATVDSLPVTRGESPARMTTTGNARFPEPTIISESNAGATSTATDEPRGVSTATANGGSPYVNVRYVLNSFDGQAPVTRPRRVAEPDAAPVQQATPIAAPTQPMKSTDIPSQGVDGVSALAGDAIQSAHASSDTRPATLKSGSGAAHVALLAPLRGRISSQFGSRRDPINGKHSFHTGVDLAAPRGTAIHAAASGTVVAAGWRRHLGNTVTIEHADGSRTKYAHAERLFVAKGDEVKSGQTIAAVGSTGRTTGPHLHFEVIQDGKRVNPLKALSNDLRNVRR